jgi:hypothetical protein
MLHRDTTACQDNVKWLRPHTCFIANGPLALFFLTLQQNVAISSRTAYRICRTRQNFPTPYGIRMFITVFTRVLYWSLSWATSIQSIPPNPISARSILMLSAHLRIVLSSGALPSDFPHTYMHSSPSPFVLHALPISSYETPHYSVRTTGFLDFVHRPEFEILENGKSPESQ